MTVESPPRFGGASYLGYLDDLAVNVATSQIASANNYVARITQLASELNPPSIIPVFPTIDNPPDPNVPEPPPLTTTTFTMPTSPTAFTDTITIDAILPAPFDDTPPVLSFGTAPASFSENLPAAPGVETDYAYPTLNLSLPAPPALLSLNVRQFDGVNIPTVDFTIPELTIVAPEPLTYVPEDHYTSALLTDLKTTLQDRITNGGTGLNPAVEVAIWDRGREREARTMRDQLDDLDRYETLGYALPPGVWLDARLKVATENAYANMGLSREIMIKQAELELQNVVQSLQIANQLEGQLITYTNQREQRAFEAYRYATEAAISIYNAKVQAYTAYVDAYKAKVQIYDALVRAEIAKVEAYKAEIGAEQAKASINTALVEQYKVQADVALSNVEVYKAQIEAIRSKAEIERLKVEIYGEQIKGYTAKINAYTAQVEGFRASVQAEASKQEAFRSRVEAYTAQVTASTKVIDAKIAEQGAKIQAKSLEWDGYKAFISGEAARTDAVAKLNSATVDSYQAEVSAFSSYNQAVSQQWEAAVRQAIAVGEVGVAAQKANAEAYISSRSVSLDAAKVGAQVSAQIGAAALSVMNISQSYSVSSGTSMNSSWSQNYSESASISL